YLQLVLGAVMRHTQSGLAIPDFPTMGGSFLPVFNDSVMHHINDWRYMNGYDPVTLSQVIYHFLHRLGALFVLGAVIMLNVTGFNDKTMDPKLKGFILIIDALITIQIALGVWTVLSLKHPHITSVHVMMGAAMLGFTFLMLLKSAPKSFNHFKATWN
ncbi:MAG: COX15/CtaA family protein, partial [Candidatus Omnitrophica bacterium]|nr:COX15/CtaA family protein [Candidatus Omnitrophota bacterium]